MFFSYVTNAIKQLVKNKGRSTLTMLGIIIGIGSVIFIMSSGEVAKNYLIGQISQFGTNVIELGLASTFGIAGDTNDDVRITKEDVEAIENSALLPELSGISTGKTALETLEWDGERTSLSIYGDRADIFPVNNLDLKAGRFFTDSDVTTAERVVVIGENLADDFFETRDVIGERVKIGGTVFRIIGIAEDLNAGPFSGGEVVFVPLTTVQQNFFDPSEAQDLDYMLVEFEPGTDVASFKDRLEYVLRSENGILDTDENPFFIVSREEGLEIFNNILLAVQAFVAAVASISLVVGGIGIMNIMLVTVSERTKEIGLRKAIGAKNRSVLTQFLIESVVLTTVGGIIGIVLGLGLTYGAVVAANYFQPTWGITFVWVPSALIVATSVSVVVGLVFGIYPAVRASKLHPIEALRYE